MTLVGGQTPDQLRTTLDILLSQPRQAKVPTETGFDDETLAALQAVWTAGANPETARIALEAQIDGTHERAREARLEAMFQASLLGP